MGKNKCQVKTFLSLNFRIINNWFYENFMILNTEDKSLFVHWYGNWWCWNPVDTGRKLKVHKMFRRRPGRLLNVLCTFNLRPVSTGNAAQHTKLENSLSAKRTKRSLQLASVYHLILFYVSFEWYSLSWNSFDTIYELSLTKLDLKTFI